MLVGCICKDYVIEIDGKKEKIKNEKLIGVFSSRIADLDFKDDEIYFKGVSFLQNKKKPFEYEVGGTVELTRKEFCSRVSIFHDIF